MTDTDTSVLRRVEAVGEMRVLAIRRTYDADVEDVWSACTDAERIPRWFIPIEGDLRLHGRYRLEGHAGGVVEVCDPPRHFRATWEYDGEVTWIDLTLTAAGGATRFELTQTIPADNSRWLEFGPGATGVGWELMLHGLGLHLDSGAPVDPAEGAGWLASADGRSFVTDSSQAWAAADIETGTDPAEARAAADRTTAAYTGAPGE